LNFKDGFDVLAEGYLLCTANRVGSLDYYLPNRICVSGYGLLGVRVGLDDRFSAKTVECANYVPAPPGRFE
jgi:hypothetical protein